MNIDEIEKVQQTLMERIAEAQVAGAQNYRRELRTSRAALRAINKLLAEMRAELLLSAQGGSCNEYGHEPGLGGSDCWEAIFGNSSIPS